MTVHAKLLITLTQDTTFNEKLELYLTSSGREILINSYLEDATSIGEEEFLDAVSVLINDAVFWRNVTGKIIPVHIDDNVITLAESIREGLGRIIRKLLVV